MDFADRQAASFGSFDDVRKSATKVCGVASMEAALKAAYPDWGARDLYVPTSGFKHILDAMDAGECDAGVMPLEIWEQFGQSDDGHCRSKLALPATIMSLSTVLPLRPELARPLSWAIEKAREQGDWAVALNQAEEDHLPPPACQAAVSARGKSVAESPRRRRLQSRRRLQRKIVGASAASASSTASASGDDSEGSQLELEGAAGPCIIAVITSTLALLIYTVERILHVNYSKERRRSRARTDRAINFAVQRILDRTKASVAASAVSAVSATSGVVEDAVQATSGAIQSAGMACAIPLEQPQVQWQSYPV